jgi:hypothetical protein
VVASFRLDNFVDIRADISKLNRHVGTDSSSLSKTVETPEAAKEKKETPGAAMTTQGDKAANSTPRRF